MGDIVMSNEEINQVEIFEKLNGIKLLPSLKTTSSKQLNAKLDDILVKQAKQNYKKRNPWESEFEELTKDNYFFKPKGTV